MSAKQPNTQDCTNKCQSTQHGAALTAAITKRCVSDTELCAYLSYTCCNCESIKDSEGRTVLHVASSCGRTDLVRWLVESRCANLNAKDRESGYTALHRSVFYGKIDTAVELIRLGAATGLQDNNGLTYLEHVMLDRFCAPCPTGAGGELFTWGSNSNNSLGSQQTRTVPESMDIFHKQYPNENVLKILINQFHSIILTEAGSVYTCGHGQGGRLGLGIQRTEVIPKPLHFPIPASSVENFKITSCSIARDHSLFLSATGELFACGLNKHKVLGITPAPAELLTPKLVKSLSGGDETSFVAAGNYHSLFWNKSGIFSWGLNAGQLGHQLINPIDNKYILNPKCVKCITLNDNQIKLVATSTGATVVYTDKGDIYVLHEYQCRKIASRQLNIAEITVIGGKLNHTLDPELSNKTRELKVAALTNIGNILLWQESDPVLRRCVLSINRALNVKQLKLNDNSRLLFVTDNREAFEGELKQRKKKPVVPEKERQSTKSDFNKFLEKDECLGVKLERIARVHRAVSIESDPKGQNFAIIQEPPYKFLKFNSVSASTMYENMLELLTMAACDDDISDIHFQVADKLFPCHRYILASKSNFFANLFCQNPQKVIEIKGYHSGIFQQLLKYVYTGSCDLTQPGELQYEALLRLSSTPTKAGDNKENAIISNPVRMLHEMAKRFELIELQKVLGNLDMVKNVVRVKRDGKLKKGALIFNKHIYSELYDVEIVCKDQRVLKAHKCILASRLDYFGNMFSSRWSGSSTSQITMPFSKGVVEALLEFLYTDSLDRLEERDVDQLFNIIILADQFFVTRLKDQCENILSDLLTIKNAVQLLVFADAYNADNLKENCFEFIQQNMTSFLELRLLDDLEMNVLKELSEFYQVKRGLDCRVITPYSTAASDEEIALISCLYPVDINVKMERGKKSSNAAGKKRSRSHRTSGSSEKPLLSRSLESDSSSFMAEIVPLSTSQEKEESTIARRIQAITLASEISSSEEWQENFTTLTRLSAEFPLLSSPPSSNGFHNVKYKGEFKQKMVKLSQKQRKRLSSESAPESPATTLVSESPKNPWKVLDDPASPVNSPGGMDMIIFSERKQKENLVKITSKQLVFTQMEDKAIEELRRFYNVDNSEEEIILIERVSVGAVALPIWVPKSK